MPPTGARARPWTRAVIVRAAGASRTSRCSTPAAPGSSGLHALHPGPAPCDGALVVDVGANEGPVRRQPVLNLAPRRAVSSPSSRRPVPLGALRDPLRPGDPRRHADRGQARSPPEPGTATDAHHARQPHRLLPPLVLRARPSARSYAATRRGRLGQVRARRSVSRRRGDARLRSSATSDVDAAARSTSRAAKPRRPRGRRGEPRWRRTTRAHLRDRLRSPTTRAILPVPGAQPAHGGASSASTCTASRTRPHPRTAPPCAATPATSAAATMPAATSAGRRGLHEAAMPTALAVARSRRAGSSSAAARARLLRLDARRLARRASRHVFTAAPAADAVVDARSEPGHADEALSRRRAAGADPGTWSRRPSRSGCCERASVARGRDDVLKALTAEAGTARIARDAGARGLRRRTPRPRWVRSTTSA